MRAVLCNVILTSASTRADGSIGLRLATPELKPEEKATFFELQGVNCKMILEPDADGLQESKEIKGEFDQRTPGQRLRNTLFVYWKQLQEPGDFDSFYRRNMERIIDYVKTKLNPA